MSNLLIKNIGQLYQIDKGERNLVRGVDMAVIPSLKDTYLLIEDGKIADFGPMTAVPSVNCEILNADGKMILPAWCDSHTHIVFPATREDEFIDKIKGLTYEEIAKKGGGILNSAKRMESCSEEDLFQAALARLDEMVKWGTGAVEIKSGYGLNTSQEIKMLRVIKRLKEESQVTIKSTFLGAHAIPADFKNNRDGYITTIIEEMLPQIASEELADFVDVFCDKGFFTIEETGKILEAAAGYGLRPKIHANELGFTGGVQIGVKHNALSVDHLEYIDDQEIDALKKSNTMPVILPGAAFFLRMPLSPARKMITAGLPLALATDFNPGSSPSGNMQWIISMGSILYRMLPEEVINAITINGAYAMGLEKELGTITIGKRANLVMIKPIPSIAYLPYAFGENKVETVILNGKIVSV